MAEAPGSAAAAAGTGAAAAAPGSTAATAEGASTAGEQQQPAGKRVAGSSSSTTSATAAAAAGGSASEDASSPEKTPEKRPGLRGSGSGGGSGGGGGGSSGAAGPETVYRILIQSKRVGSVIGKQGAIIKQLREETGARLKIADSVQGVDERVMIIAARDAPGTTWSAAQEALFRVHQRIVEGDGGGAEPNMLQDSPSPSHSKITTRLLVAGSQAGSLIGKGGDIIKSIRETSGATIRILPPEDLPACALPTDRVVQVTGDTSTVRSALQLISKQLRENPPKERPSGGYLNTGGRQYAQPSQQAASWPYSAVFPGPITLPGGMAGLPPPSGAHSSPVTAQISVPNTLIGSVIGKGGSNIAQVRQLSGAHIKIHDQREGSIERMVEITGTSDQVAAAQSLVQAYMLSSMSISGSASPGPSTNPSSSNPVYSVYTNNYSVFGSQ